MFRRVLPVVLLASVALWASQALAQQVTALWAQNCASCHAQDGSGGPLGTLSLLKDDLFGQDHDRRMYDAIRNGVEGSPMNAFSGVFDEATTWALVVHIRELQHAERVERIASPTPREHARDSGHVFSTQRRDFRIETVAGDTEATRLQTPWAVDFLPGGEGRPGAKGGPAMLITEKGGSLRVLRDGALSTPIQGLPQVSSEGQGGLMDVAVHPDFASNGWVYLASSERHEGQGGRYTTATMIVRGRIARIDTGEPAWVDQETIFQARPESRINNGKYHFGCRLAFDPPAPDGKRAGFLFFSIGDHGQMKHAQDLTRHNGKVHRVHDDGAIPTDNPFVGRESDVYASIWTFGNRNPQALAFDAQGRLWSTEHGMRGGDELNLIEKGRNYGWPLVTFGHNYADTPFRTPWPELHDDAKDKDIAMPVLRWMPSLAVCGMAAGDSLRGWQLDDAGWGESDLFCGGLAMNTVHRVRIGMSANATPTVLEDEEVLRGLGRVRDVVWGPRLGDTPDLYVVLNGPDRIIRLVEARE